MTLSPTDAQRAHAEERRWHPTKALQCAAWAEHLGLLVRILAHRLERHPAPSTRLFWIRLHGAITEIAEYCHATAERNPGTLSPEQKSAWDSCVGAAREANVACGAMKAAFKHEELVYIDYRRQCEGHVLQDRWIVRVDDRSRKLRDRHKIAALGSHFAVEELHRAFWVVLHEHGSGRDDRLVARVFAKRIAGHVHGLCEALRRLTVAATNVRIVAEGGHPVRSWAELAQGIITVASADGPRRPRKRLGRRPRRSGSGRRRSRSAGRTRA